MVVNFMDDDPMLDEALQRLEAAFGGAVLAMPALYDPNIVAFAFKGVAPAFEWEALRRRAEVLEARFGLPFARYVSRLRAMNRCSARELIISP
jgi:spermidine synthase